MKRSKTTLVISDDLVYEIAKFLHERYEFHSEKELWNTQQICKVPFDDLPKANKKVMLAVSKDLLNLVFGSLQLYSVLGKDLVHELVLRQFL